MIEVWRHGRLAMHGNAMFRRARPSLREANTDQDECTGQQQAPGSLQRMRAAAMAKVGHGGFFTPVESLFGRGLA
jgi:hypothetical protein